VVSLSFFFNGVVVRKKFILIGMGILFFFLNINSGNKVDSLLTKRVLNRIEEDEIKRIREKELLESENVIMIGQLISVTKRSIYRVLEQLVITN